MSSPLVLPARAGWFGPPTRRAFRWFHPATSSREMGVVLCPPLGHELLCTYRAYRQLAEQLAALGFPVLRFDYPGTGDAPGSDRDPDRVRAWLDGVLAAIDELRARSGVTRIALFGVRIGATLAGTAAAERGGVDALVLVAPCVTGNNYLRETRAMRMMRDRGELRTFAGQLPGDEEALGFVFRKQTMEDLAKVDLRELRTAPAPRVLVVPRDDLPGGEDRFVKKFEALGSKVEVERVPGYAAAIAEDPYFVAVPETIWLRVGEWLSAIDGGKRILAVASTAPSEHVEPIDDVIDERVVRYGANESLVGILTQPRVPGRRWAVVIPNTGANPRMGTHRFGVALCRRLATRGVAALRIDIAGLGDSPVAPGHRENEIYADDSAADARAAMNALESRGYTSFVLMGLCSGGYVSFHAALADPRARGLVMMNPLAFEWEPGREVERNPERRAGGFRSARYYRKKTFRMETWKRLLRGEIHVRGIAGVLGRRAATRAVAAAKVGAVWLGRQDWVMSDLARKFASLVRRGTRVLLVFNGDESMLDEVGKQFGAVEGWLRKRGLSIEVIDGTDHVFVPIWSQDRVLEIVCDFVARLAAE